METRVSEDYAVSIFRVYREILVLWKLQIYVTKVCIWSSRSGGYEDGTTRC
jgi:hypothetical protein